MLKTGDTMSNDFEAAMAFEMVPRLDRMGRFEEAQEVINAMARKGTTEGRRLQLFSLWSKRTPQGMGKWATKVLKEAGIEDDAFVAEIRRRMESIK